MAILFLTGCLEPGKDGVGDYTRALAIECVRQNRDCCLIALNDHYITEPVEAIEVVEGTPISILRLPTGLAWKERSERARAFRSKQAIEWVSLQLVSYGLNSKGVVRGLARYLEPVISGNPLHIMFHETWIGAGPEWPFKVRLIGQIQRYFIRDLVERLKPRLVTTSNSFYASLLHGIGLDAVELPLFGNISIRPAHESPLVPEALVASGICDAQGRHPNRWFGLFFGMLNREWKEEPFMDILARVSKETGRRAALVSAGRLGGAGEDRWRNLHERFGKMADFCAVGECSPGEISTLMQVADFGLATTPWYVIGKSGSVAAMLDHGLPVISTIEDVRDEAFPPRTDEPLLHRCDATLEAKLRAGLPRRAPRQRVREVAGNLVDRLEKMAP